MRRNSKITAAILLTLWLVPVLAGFVFYGIVVIKALEAGKAKLALVFTVLFVAVCVYLYRTFAIRDAIQSWFR